MKVIIDVLHDYGVNSGQLVNAANSSIFFWGVAAQRRQQQLEEVTGMQITSMPFTQKN